MARRRRRNPAGRTAAGAIAALAVAGVAWLAWKSHSANRSATSPEMESLYAEAAVYTREGKAVPAALQARIDALRRY